MSSNSTISTRSLPLRITAESYLLTSSGEGSALVDSEVTMHPTGFPTFPARRLKGLLKESLMEVMEIQGKTKTQIENEVSTIFGSADAAGLEGMLWVPNLFPKGWNTIKSQLENAKTASKTKEVQLSHAFQPHRVRQFYTHEIQQTAIGDDSIAKDQSLRNYLVLKPGIVFEGILTLKGTNESVRAAQELLTLAFKHLRYAGTRRNRGFGKIKCELISQVQPSLPVSTSSLPTVSKGQHLKIIIKTLSPVILAQQIGEQNTVYTAKWFSGNQIRGILARLFREALKKDGVAVPVHQDETFYNLFLSNLVQYSYCVQQGDTHIPFNLHYKKGSRNPTLLDLFETDTNKLTKVSGKFGYLEKSLRGYEAKPSRVATDFHFHNTRENRTAGRNTRPDDGGIFYYQSLGDQQEFVGTVQGEASYLQSFIDTLGTNFQAKSGKSRSAQYGLIEVSLIPEETKSENHSLKEESLLIFARTPVVLLNEWGIPSPNQHTLKQYFQEAGLEINILNSSTRTVYVEQYNTQWASKSGKSAAFSQGSVWKIKLKKPEKAWPKLEQLRIGGLGEGVKTGFGKVEILYSSDLFPSLTKASSFTSQIPPTEQWKTSPELVAIMEAAKWRKEVAKLKRLAFREANPNEISNRTYQKLSNSLIGRMELALSTHTTMVSFQSWLEDLAGKEAGKRLKKARLLDSLQTFEGKIGNKDLWDTSQKFDLSKIYWQTFFGALRKWKKLEKNGN